MAAVGSATSTYVAALPKVELHVHLEGSMSPRTVFELARRNGVALPADGPEQLESWLQLTGAHSIFGVFSLMCSCLKEAADFELATYEFGAEMARLNIRYAEVHFSVALHAVRGVDFDRSFDGITRGRDRVLRDFGVEIAWIFAVMRGSSFDANSRTMAADYAVSAAIEGMSDGVVAVGLGGAEFDGDIAAFAPYFLRAREAGLHVVPHAGEFAGPANVRAALDALGAERIAHGVRAAEDPELVRRLAAAQVCLDLCPSSNVRLGVYPSYDSHPIAKLREEGVPVSVSTDDPGIFGHDLNDELQRVLDHTALDPVAVESLQIDAVKHSFLPPNRKLELEKMFRAEFERIRPSV